MGGRSQGTASPTDSISKRAAQSCRGAARLAPFRNVRRFVAAGERLPAPLLEQWREATGGEILSLYGMSETFCACMVTPPGTSNGLRTGKPLAGVDTRLVTAEGRNARAGEAAELWLRHPALALGYANQPAQTAAQFREGWFCTRDLFVEDAEGFFFHQGRSDERLKIAGQWVQPGELEEAVAADPAISEVAHAHGARVLMDNTWATPLYFPALARGVDLAIQSGTKYIGGHSDVMIGAVAANADLVRELKETVFTMGLCVGPDDMYLALRGLRTLSTRLAVHQESGLAVARWLADRPEVLAVLHPALESHPGHAIWKRDFSGASGLFSVVFKPVPTAAVRAFLNALTLFGIGASWGGYESLAIPFDCTKIRTATHWAPGGPSVRLHIGLEDVGDLIADLERGFAAFAAAL